MNALINERDFADVFEPKLGLGDKARVCCPGHELDWVDVEVIGDKGATLLVKSGDIIRELKRDSLINIKRF